MKWTIRIELTPDGNDPISSEIGYHHSSDHRSVAGADRTDSRRGQQLLRRVQVEMISSQAPRLRSVSPPLRGVWSPQTN